MLKLNGGLGTSMGLEKAKSLLEVGIAKSALAACHQAACLSMPPSGVPPLWRRCGRFAVSFSGSSL